MTSGDKWKVQPGGFHGEEDLTRVSIQWEERSKGELEVDGQAMD